jgi:hypothetical protein
MTTLEQIDADGALCEALDTAYGSTRAEFLAKAALGSAALIGAIAAAPPAHAQGGDTAILNFDLTFEYLQASFYNEAETLGTIASMSRDRAFWAVVLGTHERAHVKILREVLGRNAVAKPFFNFGGITEKQDEFTRTAVAMEDLTVALLTGQVPRFEDRRLTAAVFTLLTTEARHAAWARRIVGFQPVVRAFDEPKSISEVENVVAATNFIAARPRTRRSSQPRFTG